MWIFSRPLGENWLYKEADFMVWNVLWLAAMAAASALAGFCMGRLSVRMEESYEEDGQGERIGRGRRRSGAWEVEAVGQWNVRLDQGDWEAAQQRVRKTERVEREALEDGGQKAVSGQSRLSASSHIGERSRVGQRIQVGTAGWLSDRIIRGTGGNIRPVRRSNRGRNQQAPEGQKWSVGSPVKGWITSFQEGEHPMMVIQPETDKLYAPAGGKIIKLFPMGNAFMFRTEFGTELCIQVGNVGDDLLGRYFRPRVVQNEIVSKGKLLLEFDCTGLVTEGVSPAVTVTVENHSYGTSVRVTAEEQIKVGEEILQVTEHQGLGSVR